MFIIILLKNFLTLVLYKSFTLIFKRISFINIIAKDFK
jgi:hypothetical protein